jgi:hypothetical protein
VAFCYLLQQFGKMDVSYCRPLQDVFSWPSDILLFDGFLGKCLKVCVSCGVELLLE